MPPWRLPWRKRLPWRGVSLANLDQQLDLSAAIAASTSLKAWLDASNIDSDSVIAIGVNVDGSVEVYEG